MEKSQPLDRLRRIKQNLIREYRARIGKYHLRRQLCKLPSSSPLLDTPIFIINLERDSQKREFIRSQMDRLGIRDITFFPAIDAKSPTFKQKKLDLGYDDKLTLQYETSPLSDAIIALTATHYAIYDVMVRDNLESAFIFEDDAVFVNSATQAYGTDPPPTDWDLVMLEAWVRSKPPQNQLSELHFGMNSYKGGTAGYHMRLSGAKKLLSCSFPLLHPPDGNLTWYNIHRTRRELNFSKDEGEPLNVYLNYPFPVINGSLAGYWRSSCDGLWVPY